jgi:cellulose synthase operon protein B
VELTGTSGSPSDFFSLGSLFRGGVDVVLPSDPAQLVDAMTLFNATVAGLLPDAAQVNVRLDSAGSASQKPFIVVSRSIPAGTNPNLRFDKGRFTVNRADGAVLLDVATGEVPAIAQIVQTETATGIWLRPGSIAATKFAKPVKLDRGNVAVIDDSGIALAFSNGINQVVNISYVEIRTLTDLALEYRPWVVGGVWFALSLLFAFVLSRVYRSRRRG